MKVVVQETHIVRKSPRSVFGQETTRLVLKESVSSHWFANRRKAPRVARGGGRGRKDKTQKGRKKIRQQLRVMGKEGLKW